MISFIISEAGRDKFNFFILILSNSFGPSGQTEKWDLRQEDQNAPSSFTTNEEGPLGRFRPGSPFGSPFHPERSVPSHGQA